jgi:hypothetical protein
LWSYVLGGFEISGSAFRQNGRAFTLFANSNDSSIDSGLQHGLPNIVGAPILPHNIDCWYYQSNSALCRAQLPGTANWAVVPAPGVYGNSGRNTLRGPSSSGTDLSIHRVFPLSEARLIEFRWEIFNVLNHPLFGLPTMNMSGGSAGAVTSLAGDPRIMQFALRFRF